MKFVLSENSKCLICTPFQHLKIVKEFVQDNLDYFLIEENINKKDLVKLCNSNKQIKYLFVNPNSQGFLIDQDILSNIEINGINTCSTGTNHIDLDFCEKRKIIVLSLKNDFELINNLPSTSELAFGLMQSLFRKMILCHSKVIDHEKWEYRDVMGNQLAGKKIGCLGYGRLGRIFCKQLSGFDVEIKVCEKENIELPKSIEKLEINQLFETCDAVAMHIHSNKENKNIINSNLLEKTKKGFILVNTSRGDLCNEYDITNYIISGHLGGYGTDVLKTEFSDIRDSPIFKIAKEKIHNIIITPHVGGMTYEGQSKAFLYALKKFTFN